MPFGPGSRLFPLLPSVLMEREPGKTNHAARLFGALGLLGMTAVVVAWLAPGGLGEASAVEVTGGASASAYRWLNRAVADAPSWLGPLLELATEGTLVILGLLLVWKLWTSFRGNDIRGIAGSMLTGLGTVAAYAVSEAVKLVVDEERPCRALATASAGVAECPEPGDWAFPSNHATLAAGLAVGLAMLWPRLAAITLPLAGTAALLRVLVGVHYPHDVLAGALLGGAVVAAALLALMSPAQWAVSRVWRLRRNDPGLVRHDRGSSPIVHPQPRQDGTHVGFDRSLHNMQPSGNLPVGQAAPQEGQHLEFPGREGGDPVTRGTASTGPAARARRGQVRHNPGRNSG